MLRDIVEAFLNEYEASRDAERRSAVDHRGLRTGDLRDAAAHHRLPHHPTVDQRRGEAFDPLQSSDAPSAHVGSSPVQSVDADRDGSPVSLDQRRASASAILQSALVVGLLGVLLAVIWMAHDVLLVLSLGVLAACGLCGLTRWVSNSLHLGRKWSLAIVVATLALLAFGSAFFCYSQAKDQLAKMERQFDDGLSAADDWLSDRPVIRSMVVDVIPEGVSGGAAAPNEAMQMVAGSGDGPPASANDHSASSGEKKSGSGNTSSSNGNANSSTNSAAKPSDLVNSDSTFASSLPTSFSNLLSLFGRFFATTLGVTVNLLLILFIGLFLAADPHGYRDATVRLFPPRMRSRTREVMDEMGEDLWRFLIGRFLSMMITGVGAGILLALCGVPLPIALGLLTGLLTFIPNIGAAIALGLAVLAALPQGSSVVMTVIAGYIGLQLFESYVITPLITKAQVELPPAMTLAGQAVFGVMFGFLGALTATHVLVVIKRLVDSVYIDDTLEQPSAIATTAGAAAADAGGRSDLG